MQTAKQLEAEDVGLLDLLEEWSDSSPGTLTMQEGPLARVCEEVDPSF